MLMKLTTVVNDTNILWAAFVPMYFAKQITKRVEENCTKHFFWKVVCKMLAKLPTVVNYTNIFLASFMQKNAMPKLLFHKQYYSKLHQYT